VWGEEGCGVMRTEEGSTKIERVMRIGNTPFLNITI
jgi:hypothetical protein